MRLPTGKIICTNSQTKQPETLTGRIVGKAVGMIAKHARRKRK